MTDTRFEQMLVPSNFLDRLQVVSDSTRRWSTFVQQTSASQRAGFHGEIARDPQYSGVITFSDDDGVTFTPQLVNPVGNRIVQLRLAVTQHQVQPMLRGYRFDWYLPSGWTFTDALGTTTYEEAVSNPTIITRVMLSPVNPQPVGFRVLVVERFT
jgi:hypothetical protein